MEGGQQFPAQGMGDENEVRDGGHQLPAQGMEVGNMRAGGGQQSPAQWMEDGNGRREGDQQRPAQRMEEENQEVRRGREVRGLEEGEGEDNSDRIRPVIPPPNPEAGRGPDIDGWATIGRVGAWDAMLTEFCLLDEVPEQHKSVWVWAAAEIL